MLQRLTIRNYALIEELDISFSKGMTIITGETGAGKSILLGALSVLLGQRADSSALLKKDSKCIIEGVFNIADYDLKKHFEEADLDYDDVSTIRREITVEGKSRAFINDTPVNLSVLKELSVRLIDIHSQHESLILNNASFQLLVTDSFAGNGSLLKPYKKLYQDYQKKLVSLEELRSQEAQSKKDSDYHQFLFNELEEADLKTGEQEDLEKELTILNSSEDIKSALSKATHSLNTGEENLVSALHNVSNTVQSITKVFPAADDIANRFKILNIELKDLASEIESLESQVNYDPQRVQLISERLDVIYRLEKKHKVNSVDELLQIRADLQLKLLGIGSLEERIVNLEKEVTQNYNTLLKQADAIHETRVKAAPVIEKNISGMLQDLGMKHAVLKIELNTLSLNENGKDQTRFLFSANKGVEYRELQKVASGGELSRLMLCIKSMLAKLRGLPSIIFDEIDTGISGEVARKVGNIIREISNERQVIVITHLPQMAGKGHEHYFVYKETSQGGTSTKLKKLNKQERVEEIAKMLSGNQPSKAAIANARELLDA